MTDLDTSTPQASATPEAAPAELIAEVERLGEKLSKVRTAIGRIIFGQEEVVDQTLITLLAGGHVLLIGVPGLAKTRLVETLGTVLGLEDRRIQCTPDLMPADILGSEILEEGDNGRRAFRFLPGPVFCQLLMADEINRASPRTQSALLQAMQEHRVSVAGHYHDLPKPFHVLATQNPLEQEGTYPLPEAQLDRFLMHVTVDYPARDDEQAILRLALDEARAGEAGGRPASRPVSQADILRARDEVLEVHVSAPVEAYILELVLATRSPDAYGEDIASWIQYGGSPRATIGLDRCARAHAWLAGRDYVDPGDVQAVVHDVLRHRLILHYEAEAEGISSDRVIDELVARVAVP